MRTFGTSRRRRLLVGGIAVAGIAVAAALVAGRGERAPSASATAAAPNRIEVETRPPARPPLRDLVYARRPGGIALGLDVTYPASLEPAPPIVVLVHGGGWWKGDKSDMRTQRGPAAILASAGFIAVTPNYRLACRRAGQLPVVPGHVFDAPSDRCGARLHEQVADVRAALAWVRDHGLELGGDPSRIGLLGISAGGTLALLAAAADDANARGVGDARLAAPVRAVVNWSGPPATQYLAEQTAAEREADGSLRPSLENAIGCAPDACPERWRAASARVQLAGRTPPFAVQSIGGADELQVPHAQLEAFHDELAARGVTSELLAGARDCHGLLCSNLRVAGSERVGWQHSMAFLQRELGLVAEES